MLETLSEASYSIKTGVSEIFINKSVEKLPSGYIILRQSENHGHGICLLEIENPRQEQACGF